MISNDFVFPKLACPSGTYKPEGSPGGVSTCISCPDPNHTSPPGSTSVEDCVCKEGYEQDGPTCKGMNYFPFSKCAPNILLVTNYREYTQLCIFTNS